jgi:hypothetical protein
MTVLLSHLPSVPVQQTHSPIYLSVMLPQASHTPIIPFVHVTCIMQINLSVCLAICVKSDIALGVSFHHKIFVCFSNLIPEITDLFETERGVIYFMH